MNCPKCRSTFEKVTYEHIEVDRCMGCQGLWFDMLEAEHLAGLKGSEKIDVGSRKLGHDLNKISKVDCPVCHVRMIPMVDSQQPHIWYEACTACYGVFFDAGEFADYKSHTVMDFFRDLFHKQRA